jgi:hypothetical protein
MSAKTNFWPNAKWAAIEANTSLVALSTCSGFRSTVDDPLGERLMVARKEATFEWLGAGLLKCLAASRVLATDEQRKELYGLENLKRNYEKRVAELMAFAGVQTRRTLFREMHSCSVTLADGEITIKPSLHEKLEAWSGLTGGDANNVRVAAAEPPEVIGAAVIEALKRCWPPYPWQKEL